MASSRRQSLKSLMLNLTINLNCLISWFWDFLSSPDILCVSLNYRRDMGKLLNNLYLLQFYFIKMKYYLVQVK